jgi:tetratricopeptide (TPR) repeat protein
MTDRIKSTQHGQGHEPCDFCADCLNARIIASDAQNDFPRMLDAARRLVFCLKIGDDAGRARAWAYVALAFIGLEKFEDARAATENAFRFNDRDDRLCEAAAHVLLEEGLIPKAVIAFEKALHFCPVSETKRRSMLTQSLESAKRQLANQGNHKP